MKNLIFVLCFGFLFLSVTTALSAESKDGSTLPELTLTAPENSEHLKYLGLSAQPGEQFKLTDIQADILVIELFSMYCPYCQKEAPLVNEFYELIRQREDKGVKVKIIGLGASNSQFEVEHFATTYEVSFPLFPDKDMSLYKALGGDGTPGFVGFKLKDSDPPVNVLRNSGGFYNAEDFYQDILQNSGL